MRPDTAIVIGGGPAGSLAALLLARAGVGVTLVEQSRFPRDKVCGECVSALGLSVLRRHRVAAELEAAGRSLVRGNLFGRTMRATVDLPSPMLGVSRSLLDAALLTAAASAGVRIMQPARAESVDDRADCVSVRVRLLPTNELIDIPADVAFVADGRAALTTPRPSASGDLGIKAHFTHVAADPAAVTLYGGLGCYGGVAPVEHDGWNVAFAVPRDRIAAVRGDLDRWWQSIVAASPAVARHFAKATRVGDWLASPLPRYGPSPGVPGRVIPVGAAAAAIEPVGGEGMGTALRSAELAVEAALDGRVASLPHAYGRLWNRRGRFCRLGAVLLSGPALSDAVWFAGDPWVGRMALKVVGK